MNIHDKNRAIFKNTYVQKIALDLLHTPRTYYMHTPFVSSVDRVYQKWLPVSCKSTNTYYMRITTIFVATLATLLLLAKLGAKLREHPKQIVVKAKNYHQ